MLLTVIILMLKMCPSLCQMQAMVPVGWEQAAGQHHTLGRRLVLTQDQARQRPRGQEAAPAPHPHPGPAVSGRASDWGGVRGEPCGLGPVARQQTRPNKPAFQQLSWQPGVKK